MKIFAERLKDLRRENGLSMAALAKTVEVSTSAIKQWEKQERIPNAKAVLDLARFFGVSTDYLLGAED
jgi:transcriptional regulator with XRE-family HTH domain